MVGPNAGGKKKWNQFSYLSSSPLSPPREKRNKTLPNILPEVKQKCVQVVLNYPILLCFCCFWGSHIHRLDLNSL